jgi:hypothetical protein
MRDYDCQKHKEHHEGATSSENISIREKKLVLLFRPFLRRRYVFHRYSAFFLVKKMLQLPLMELLEVLGQGERIAYFHL